MRKKIYEIIDRYWWVILILLSIAFLATRLVKLDSRPMGMHVDEASLSLDSKYLAEYGMDRYMVRHPVYLKNYGGGQNVLYGYLAAVTIRLLGYSVFAFRLPAVICGLFCMISSYFIARDVFEDRQYALLAPFLVITIPYFFTSERWGLESNLFLSFAMISMCFFVRAIKTKSNIWYALAGILFGITLYSYAITYIVLPLFLGFSIIYLLMKKQISWKNVFSFSIPLFLLALPLIFFQLVNMGIVPECTIIGTDFRRLDGYRASEISAENIIPNLTYIKMLIFGGDPLTYSSMPHPALGTMLIHNAVITSIGIVFVTYEIIRKKLNNIYMLLIYVFFAISWGFSFLVAMPSTNKTNQIYMPFVFIIMYTLRKFFSFIKHDGTNVYVIITGLFFIGFSWYYFKIHPKQGYDVLFLGTKGIELMEYADETYNPDGNKKIYLELQYEDQGNLPFYWHALKNIPPWEFDMQRTDYGNYVEHFPEFDENEDAIYILGENWSHIYSYLIDIGYNADMSFEHYCIVWK